MACITRSPSLICIKVYCAYNYIHKGAYTHNEGISRTSGPQEMIPQYSEKPALSIL